MLSRGRLCLSIPQSKPGAQSLKRFPSMHHFTRIMTHGWRHYARLGDLLEGDF